MGKYIPVDPEKWAAMVQAQAENKRLKEQLKSVTETHCVNTSMWKDDLNRYREICDELDAECTRLKSEVEVWKEMVADSGVACNERARENQDLENQIERLKAEVERLTAFTTRTIIPNEELQAQVERLTKAGDAFVLLLEDEGYDIESIREVDGWNAAKEGKQP